MGTATALPVIAQETMIAFLMWACGVLGAGLIASLVFIAVNVMSKLNVIEVASRDQFAAFGRQLAANHALLMEAINEHNVRLVKLEEWRRAHEKYVPIATG